MKTDRELQRDVMDELAFDPSVSAENIGVSVKDSIVVLSGTVPSYVEKTAAEKATFRVAGVKGVAEEIEVRVPSMNQRSDQEIAKAAADAMEWNATVPSTVTISVEKGKIILRGAVEWEYQRSAASLAVRYLKGVTGIVNHINVQNHPEPRDIKEKIEKALLRTAAEEAKNINVKIMGGKVTLTGKVHSHAEIEDAKYAAWAVPGVDSVETNLSIIIA